MIKLIMVVQHEIVTCEYDNIIVDNESLIVEKNNKFGILIPLVNWLQHDYESIEKILFKTILATTFIL
jgi:hypothetical protein